MKRQTLFDLPKQEKTFLINYKTDFKTANDVFEYFYQLLKYEGQDELDDVKTIPNINFYIEQPDLIDITADFRKWKRHVAYRLYLWHALKSTNTKSAPLSLNHLLKRGFLNYNLVNIWNANNQLTRAIDVLQSGGRTGTIRSSEDTNFISAEFTVHGDYLNMSVNLSKWDLWYGFCNEHLLYYTLLHTVASKCNKAVGWVHYNITTLYISKYVAYCDGMYYHGEAL